MNPLKARVYLSPPHMGGEEQKFIAEAFATNWIAPLGPNVDAFESELAAYLGVRGAVALVSGTAAIHIALILLGVGREDRVFCSTLTFSASANPILYQGAEPVFIDSEPSSWNMSPAALSRAFSEAAKNGELPKAVIVVNLYGQSADMDHLLSLCSYYKVALIEDAAESLGATYKNKKSGSFGDYGILSFNGNKIITTSSGGALVSDDTDQLTRARYLSSQARLPVKHYEHCEVGYNYRMSNILAGIGRGQLQCLDDRVSKRREINRQYREALRGIDGINFMPEATYGLSTRWLTVLTINPQLCGFNRDQVIENLEAANIESRPVWKPMHLQPLYKEKGYFQHGTEESISDRLFEEGLCLPSGSNLKPEEQQLVIQIIRAMLSGG